jgi:homoserine dehydrogenase
MPTASAVVADIAGIARDVAGETARPALDVAESPLTVRRIEDVESMYYFRFTVRDRPGVLSRISGILGDNDISIESVIQKGRQEEESVPLVMLTHRAVERDIRRALAEIDRLPVVTDATRFIRVEGEG